MTAPHPNALWGAVLLDELARAGVRQLVVAPGSRSAPLVLAAAADDRFRIHVQIDERCAGFVALGVGKATGVPAAVLTTSGTAVANLLPAVVEAFQSETPLLVLTADRPLRLRGADANQTIDQVKIFGGYLRRFEELAPAEASEGALRHLRSLAARSVAAAIGDPPGPVHLNLGFDKPLEPVAGSEVERGGGESLSAATRGREDEVPWTRVLPARAGASAEQVAWVVDALQRAEHPLILAGVLPRPWESGPAVRRLSTAWGVPVLPDLLSGARFPTETDKGSGEAVVMGGYDLALRSREVRDRLRPDLLLRLGAAPTSGILGDWQIELSGVEHLVVDGGGRWKDHAGTATAMISADPTLLAEAVADAAPVRSGVSDWVHLWTRAAAATSAELHAALQAEEEKSEGLGLLEGAVAAELGKVLKKEDILFASSSMPIRDLDSFVPARTEPLLVLGNRGASGIDGIISTAAGVSLATGRRVVALVGDLAFLHDCNGLASLRDPAVRVVLVVLNNDGGGIFHLLPIRAFEPAFTPYFATPHGRSMGQLAAFHGLPHHDVDGLRGLQDVRAGLDRVLALDGNAVLEIRTDREVNRLRRTEVATRVAAAVADALTEGRP